LVARPPLRAFLRTARRHSIKEYVTCVVRLSCALSLVVDFVPFERALLETPLFESVDSAINAKAARWAVKQRARLATLLLSVARCGRRQQRSVPFEVIVSNMLPCVWMEGVADL
jgi:hypothetical protein